MSRILGRIVDFHHANDCDSRGCGGHRLQAQQNNSSDTVSFRVDDKDFAWCFDEQEWLAMIRSYQLLGRCPVEFGETDPIKIGTILSRIAGDMEQFDPPKNREDYQLLVAELRRCARSLTQGRYQQILRLSDLPLWSKDD